MTTVPALTDEIPLDQYTASGAQTDFNFTYMIFATADIEVYVNGILKTEITDYTVKKSNGTSITATDLPLDGGKVVFTSGLILNDEVSLNRNIAIERLTGYSVAGAFRADVVNAEFTKGYAVSQQLRRDLERSVRLESFDSEGGSLIIPTGRPNTFLGFDANGDITLLAGTIDNTNIVSPFVTTLLDDLTASDFLTTLGFSTYIKTLVNDADAATARATLGVTIGADVQAYDADLASLAGLTSVANLTALAGLTGASGNFPYFTGVGAMALANFTGAIIPFAGSALPAGFLACNGAAISRTTYAGLFAVLVTADGFSAQTFTVTIASPGVFTKSAHGFLGGERIRLATTGALPTGLAAATDYYVKRIDANTFNLAATLEGTSIVTTGSQSGVHSYTQSRFGLGDGSTTFNLPDLRDQFPRGFSSTRTLGTGQLDAFQGHWHQTSTIASNGNIGTGGIVGNASAATTSNVFVVGAVTDGTNGTPRTAAETRPVNTALNYCIKF
jgi:microcystin-dependent protein